ncbi:phage holin family protein [Rhodoplanes serenus]|jgi:hypothetical protein|uniref:Phage holin family protein n=1 Tax=Rhodoplanes serenus TaxID=200615 RepID=A0A9X4XNY8_9BRAD|nr:phage holin family protein [Rhodoplanes serenus]MTW18657.1 phage holin family protein [Rhodoplanes serenus]
MGLHEHRSVPELFTDLVQQVTTLVRTETRLARAEMSEKVGQVGTGVALIVVGAVLLMPALVILLQAAVAALVDSGMEPHWAALTVGGATLVVGLVLALIGASRLKAENLTPNRTLSQLRSDAAVARNQAR